jgi:hypothetical protein
MLSSVLPENIGARIEIPNDESGLLRKVEAHGFFAEHVDEARIILRRRAGNDALRGAAVEERAKPVGGELARRVRVLPN